MNEMPLNTDHARLAMNARAYRYDPVLDPVADLMDAGDTAAWTGLHRVLVDRASIHRDFRTQYRRAVAAGAIPDDRNASTYNKETNR